MVPCGLAGHRHCIVNNGSHTFHLRVSNIFIFLFLSILFFYHFYRIVYVLLHCMCTFFFSFVPEINLFGLFIEMDSMHITDKT